MTYLNRRERENDMAQKREGEPQSKRSEAPDEPQGEYLTVADARDLLGVSGRKIAQMIADGTLPTEPHPLDKRSKLVRRADVNALVAKLPRKDAA
jgi:hypothetical protein